VLDVCHVAMIVRVGDGNRATCGRHGASCYRVLIGRRMTNDFRLRTL
jgi:hypothetical protein